MTALSWQDLVALTVVCLALAYLVHRARRLMFSGATSGCAEGCGTCPSAQRNGSKLARNRPADLVLIENLGKPTSQGQRRRTR